MVTGASNTARVRSRRQLPTTEPHQLSAGTCQRPARFVEPTSPKCHFREDHDIFGLERIASSLERYGSHFDRHAVKHVVVERIGTREEGALSLEVRGSIVDLGEGRDRNRDRYRYRR